MMADGPGPSNRKCSSCAPPAPRRCKRIRTGDKDNGPNPNNSDNGDDDGQGHQFILGTSVNDDITHLRLAETTDGIHFKDLGVLQGLNDPTDVTATGTRWLATAGTILKLGGGKFGLLYSGGGCIDGDSDAFRYIGNAESNDLLHWSVVNGLNHPIMIASPYTIEVNAAGVPVSSGGTLVTVPTTPAVGGITSGFFAGRVDAPSATLRRLRQVANSVVA